MGNTQGIPQHHVRMYSNLLAIQEPHTRIQMIQTMIHSPEHLTSMKATGVYSQLIMYIQTVQAGGKPSPLPPLHGSGAQVQAHHYVQHQQHQSQGQSHQQQHQSQGQSHQQQQQLSLHQKKESTTQASQRGNEKAVNYFSACLRILDLDEEVAITEQSLKSAYKKAVIRVHPDKGGTEKEFEAVTRAYAYLGEILKRIHGGRTKESVVEAPTALSNGREKESDKWKMVEPVALNPAKLDLNTFNSMFEKTRIPDPDETGYGDWLKGEDKATSNTFSGKFNREVFHKAFEEEQRSKGQQQQQQQQNQGGALVAQELSLSSRMGYGVELGRTTREDFTVAPNENGLHFTDLKKAYTTYNTFSQETTGVKLEAKSMATYTQDRKKAPTPYTDHELAALQAAERSLAAAEEHRKLRVAQEAVNENSYFERMKRLVIRNGPTN